MKSKEPKIVEYELKTKKSSPADEWWAAQSEEGKTIAHAVGRLIESLNKDALIQIKENGNMIQVGCVAGKGGGHTSAQCTSFPKPEACDDTWFATLPESEQQLAIGLSKVVLGDPERWRWN